MLINKNGRLCEAAVFVYKNVRVVLATGIVVCRWTLL